MELVRSGSAYVKISGAYRASSLAPDYADVVPLAQALIAANPDRVVWGTDWPHPDSATPPGGKPTDVSPLIQIDDGRLLNQLAVWAPDPAVRERGSWWTIRRASTGSEPDARGRLGAGSPPAVGLTPSELSAGRVRLARVREGHEQGDDAEGDGEPERGAPHEQGRGRGFG